MELSYRSRAPRAPTHRPPLLILLHGVGGNESALERFATGVYVIWYPIKASLP